MQKLTINDLYKLEDYARLRPEFRTKVIAHRKPRTIRIGPHITLIFEDRLSVQYQVQEMLRIERIFEPDAINHELDTYNPLIPDGRNLKATLLIEYPDPDERARKLIELRDIEHHFVLTAGELPGTTAIADEDLDRSNAEKTSAVHFLRFELNTKQIAEIKRCAKVTLAVDHHVYREQTILSGTSVQALAADLI